MPPVGDDDVGLAGLHRVAHVHPRHLFQPHGVRRSAAGFGGVGAVVRVVAAVAAAHRARIRRAALARCWAARRRRAGLLRRCDTQQMPMPMRSEQSSSCVALNCRTTFEPQSAICRNALAAGLQPERSVFHALAVLAVARGAGAAERRDRSLGGFDVVHAEVDENRVGVALALGRPTSSPPRCSWP